MRAIVVILMLVCFSAPAMAAITQDKSLFSVGGGLMSSGNYELSGDLGDIIIGPAIRGTTGIWHGFWNTIPMQLIGANEPKATLVSYLGRPWPTPAHSATFIEFSVPQPTAGSLEIYDVQGRLIKRLFSGPVQSGMHRTSWDLRSESGQAISPGVYFYRFEADGFVATRKMVLLR